MGYYASTHDSQVTITAANILAAQEALNCSSLSAYLAKEGWCLDMDDGADLWFAGDNIRGSDELLASLAKYISKGSYITMIGEDGYIWRWYFDGETMVEQAATLVFEETP